MDLQIFNYNSCDTCCSTRSTTEIFERWETEKQSFVSHINKTCQLFEIWNSQWFSNDDSCECKLRDPTCSQKCAICTLLDRIVILQYQILDKYELEASEYEGKFIKINTFEVFPFIEVQNNSMELTSIINAKWKPYLECESDYVSSLKYLITDVVTGQCIVSWMFEKICHKYLGYQYSPYLTMFRCNSETAFVTKEIGSEIHGVVHNEDSLTFLVIQLIQLFEIMKRCQFSFYHISLSNFRLQYDKKYMIKKSDEIMKCDFRLVLSVLNNVSMTILVGNENVRLSNCGSDIFIRLDNLMLIECLEFKTIKSPFETINFYKIRDMKMFRLIRKSGICLMSSSFDFYVVFIELMKKYSNLILSNMFLRDVWKKLWIGNEGDIVISMIKNDTYDILSNVHLRCNVIFSLYNKIKKYLILDEEILCKKIE